MKTTYPGDASDADLIASDPDAELHMNMIINVITGIRNIRGEMNLAPSLQLDVMIQSDDAATRDTIAAHEDIVSNLARLASIRIEAAGEKPSAAATAIVENATIFVSLEGVLDFAKETARLQKEINKIQTELIPIDKKLANENFLKKAPADVVAGVREKHAALMEKRAQLESHLEKIKSMGI